ncbi:drug/metabolite transporter (DMT)-like permease [Paenibacillus sp. PvR098]|nr:drug/metabolite transporter (DMT)-like permease [Paenibacillus sp. PvP091]MBP1172085.1 drug/metabolite transporter (DMT)-like permease [Paenibacillus sp. PvR098]MBP2438466.1 drug/metabolite transporter (DMT)-like permease [Paenibacillus sp. PvP052]
MVVIAAIWGGALRISRIWHIYLLSALFNVVLFIALQTYALYFLTSGLAVLLIYLQPILVGILAWFWLGETLSALKITGLLLGLVGVALISTLGDVPHGTTPLGIAIGVGAALVWAIGTVYFKAIQNKVTILWLVAGQFMIGGFLLLILGLSLEPWSAIQWKGPFWFSLLYTSFIGVAVAWVLWFGLIQAGQASTVSAYTFAVPLVSILMGTILLNEEVTLSIFLGAACIVSGIYFVNRQPDKKIWKS